MGYQAATEVRTGAELPVAENARLFALMSMALENCFIVDWDANSNYNSWRRLPRSATATRTATTQPSAGRGGTLNATPMHRIFPRRRGINAVAARRRFGKPFSATGLKASSRRTFRRAPARDHFASFAKMDRSIRKCESGADSFSQFRSNRAEEMGRKIEHIYWPITCTPVR